MESFLWNYTCCCRHTTMMSLPLVEPLFILVDAKIANGSIEDESLIDDLFDDETLVEKVVNPADVSMQDYSSEELTADLSFGDLLKKITSAVQTIKDKVQQKLKDWSAKNEIVLAIKHKSTAVAKICSISMESSNQERMEMPQQQVRHRQKDH